MRRTLMEEQICNCRSVTADLGFGLVIFVEGTSYLYSWEKTEQNEICRLWERPAAKPNAFLTATISHDLGSR